MAFSFSERLQIAYSDNSSKYNMEKEAKDEELSMIKFVNFYRNSCCIFLCSSHVAIVTQNCDLPQWPSPFRNGYK